MCKFNMKKIVLLFFIAFFMMGNLSFAQRNLYKFYSKKTYKYGMMDEKGNVIVPAKYDDIDDFENNRAVVAVREEYPNDDIIKYGYIDDNGKEILPVKYSYAESFFGDVAIVSMDSTIDYFLFGVELDIQIIDKNGKILHKINDARIIYKSDFKAIYLKNKSEKKINFSKISKRYLSEESINLFEYKISPNANESKVIFLSKKGKISSEYQAFREFPTHDLPSKYDNKYMEVVRNGKFGIIYADTFEKVLDTKYDYILSAIEYKGKVVFEVDLDGKRYFVDLKDKKVEVKNDLNDNYKNINNLFDRLDNLELKFSKKYDNVSIIVDNLSRNKFMIKVSKNGRWGILDENEKPVVPIKYDEDMDFYDDLFIARANGRIFIINANDEIVASEQVYGIKYRVGENFVVGNKKGDYGIMNKNGKIIVPMEYFSIDRYVHDDVEYTNNMLYAVKNADYGFVYGFINSKGDFITPKE